RDVRNGRNFEYYSEDPFHSALLGAEAVNGIQSQSVISTLKHYTLNCNETNRPLAERDHRPRGASRVRSARLPDRNRAFSTGLDHEWLQQSQRRVRQRQSLPSE